MNINFTLEGNAKEVLAGINPAKRPAGVLHGVLEQGHPGQGEPRGDGRARPVDGRHRFSVLRDMGLDQVARSVRLGSSPGSGPALGPAFPLRVTGLYNISSELMLYNSGARDYLDFGARAPTVDCREVGKRLPQARRRPRDD
jgi:hypothetical protein